MRQQVIGLRELGEAMRDLSSEVANKLARRATASAARVVQKEAKRRVPVGEKPHKVGKKIVQPGNLQKNIGITRNKKSSFTSRHDVKWRRDGFYGLFLEFGTRKMAARPFMRPALEASRGKALEAIKKTLSTGIARARKKAGLK